MPLVVPPVLKFVPVHEVALLDDHVRVDGEPVVIDVGFAESAAVAGTGAALTVTVSHPPQLLP